MTKIFGHLLLLSTLLFSLSTWGQVFDETKNLSEQYGAVLEVYNNLSPSRREEIRDATAAKIGGVSAIHPMPFVLSHEDNKLLHEGTRQISNAVRLFFEDHFSNRRSYSGQNVIDENVLKAVLDSHRSVSQVGGPVLPGSTALIVGPDIVRTQDGFRLLEVNVAGWMGGLSTMSLLNNSLVESAPEYKELFKNAPQAAGFYEALADHYQSMLRPGEVGIVIAAETSNAFEKALQKRGFLIMRDAPQVQEREGRLWISTPQGEKALGVVHLDIEASSLLYSQNGKAINDAYLTGKLHLSTPPHAEILMDKRLLPYIGRMIEFYLKEKPIITPPPSKILTVELLDRMLPNIEKYVIKMGLGRGGQSVYLGPQLAKNPSLIQHLRNQIQNSPGPIAIIQEMAVIGTRDGMQTDVRPITYVDKNKTLTTPVPWSRSSLVGEKSNVTGRYGSSTQNAVLVLRLLCKKIH